jgi:hypothetical protein
MTDKPTSGSAANRRLAKGRGLVNQRSTNKRGLGQPPGRSPLASTRGIITSFGVDKRGRAGRSAAQTAFDSTRPNAVLLETVEGRGATGGSRVGWWASLPPPSKM